MAGVNKVILIGNLGKDPEVKYLESKVPVAKFPVATNETWKDRNGEKKEHTEWHNVVLWRGLAEISEKYLQKGDRVYIEGRLRTRSWDDKDGNKRYTTDVIADNMTMLTERKDNSQASNDTTIIDENPSENPSENPPENPVNDLPF
ncbi:MAG TPA: single-stranded DNA-binding protein [Flavobacteriales bacterium]|nr:single-stranded DNA-binding protein [Flavobacteriales bacterium]HIN40616.1 single-stranded DNA-binding protein [Flavobacteriales bacterium]